MSRSRILLVVLFLAALVVPVSGAQAASTLLCSGYADCAKKGHPNHGYEAQQRTSYWRMYTGTNCTNYVAYRLVSTNGMPNVRPKAGVGNARDWGTAMASVTDSTPTVGSVAWWGRTGNHVAYVERVVSATEIIVSESNWGRPFDWRRITKGTGWPDGFIHFADTRLVASKRPTIVGSAKVGGALTASPGTWSPTPDRFTYQWLSDGAKITGATADTFVPTADEVGTAVSVKVAARRTGMTTATAKSGTLTIEADTLAATRAPAIDGTPQVGQTLSADPGTWSPSAASHTYAWTAGDVPIAGASARTFTVPAGLVGKRLRVQVTARRTGYPEARTTSALSAAVAPATMSSTVRPSISGEPRVGAPLTASPGGWSAPDVRTSHRWLVDGVAVPGVTGSTFVPRPEDVGRRVSVMVTAEKEGHTAASATSTSTPAVQLGELTNRTRPTVSGTPAVGERLVAAPGTWDGDPATTLRWTSDGVTIASAKGSSLVLAPEHQGTRIQLVVTASRPGYATASATSVRTPAVAPQQVVTGTALPVLSGSPQVGRTLSATPGRWSADATLTYRWTAGGVTIPKATGSTLTLTPDLLGSRIRVVVNATRPGWRAGKQASLATSAVEHGTITVSGRPRVEGSLAPGTRVNAGAVPRPPGAAISYQWLRDGKPIAGATGSSRPVVARDAGRLLAIRVTYTAAGYTSATATSVNRRVPAAR